jgi:hypothetical protein
MKILANSQLLEELERTMTVSRLVKTGLFAKIEPPDEIVRPHLRLYRTVLDKALLDQFDACEEYRLQSKLWADINHLDFLEVCDLALLEPEDVLELFGIVTSVFRNKGEDKYWKKDNKKLARLSNEDKETILQYEED